MAVVLVVLSGLLVLVLLAALLSWLKGTLSLVSPAGREAIVLAGEPGWWFVAGPLGVPLLLLFTAFGLAHPHSPWARRFYGERKMAKARLRYALDPANTRESTPTAN